MENVTGTDYCHTHTGTHTCSLILECNCAVVQWKNNDCVRVLCAVDKEARSMFGERTELKRDNTTQPHCNGSGEKEENKADNFLFGIYSVGCALGFCVLSTRIMCCV